MNPAVQQSALEGLAEAFFVVSTQHCSQSWVGLASLTQWQHGQGWLSALLHNWTRACKLNRVLETLHEETEKHAASLLTTGCFIR